MTQEIRDLITPSCALLALGEPTHREPAFGRVRNQLFGRLMDMGFRSIALETDRVAALAVNDFVQEGSGSLDAVMREGFSHGFGELDANRELVVRMRGYNEHRPPEERVSFHGFDAPLENASAPSPRRYLEHARDYLGLDTDVTQLAGEDTRWSRTEAVMDPAASPGATPEAERLRAIGEEMLSSLPARAPEPAAASPAGEWSRARIHLTAALGLLRYHRQCARPGLDPATRLSRLLATRDALMAQNLLGIREAEAPRGPTLVFAHNHHLQPGTAALRVADMDLGWFGAGAIVGALLGERYAFVAGALGRSAALGVGEPGPDTYEGALQSRGTAWALAAAATLPPSARTRDDATDVLGYYPLDARTLDEAAGVLHISDAEAV
ncbi:erythromycin esterase family protein [Streptomyces cucumeris]|uniref:erythromycin esterase family protein n=1 Tax=Streptomyces cucumeris TaxID=2962890 RepID=UPI003D73E526